MKYYVLEGSFVKNLPEENILKNAIDAHLEYLEGGFDNGTMLLSGPKVGAGGGVIIVKCDSIEKFCNDDPLVKAGVQEYRVSEFKLHNCQEYLKNWF